MAIFAADIFVIGWFWGSATIFKNLITDLATRQLISKLKSKYPVIFLKDSLPRLGKVIRSSYHPFFVQ